MKIVEASFEIQDDLDKCSIPVALEHRGRICYKSEDQITEDSALPFVKGVISKGHNSVLEMAVVTYSVNVWSYSAITNFLSLGLKYLFCHTDHKAISDDSLWVTGSIRAFREAYDLHPDSPILKVIIWDLAGRHPDLFCDFNLFKINRPASIEARKRTLEEVEALPDEYKAIHRHIGIRLIVNRAVTHELVRHRPCSYLQESQRYCRYSQDKFDNQVTFIAPSAFWDKDSSEWELWERSCARAEMDYLMLVDEWGNSPQAARTLLPNSCKTEIIVYCNLIEWKHIFRMRTQPAAEPSMRQIMIPLEQTMAKRYPNIFK